ncbi:hypothetical protein RI129_009498 [Pyrocoelia pectoralis]|uniref:ATPase AAA-type core domain-containing protein n=1 Tax=Pyrocoelia pectoralis TaxID=417401 RepID=A0AAN7V9G6_9COLE
MDKCTTIIVSTEGTESLTKERKRRSKLSLNCNYDNHPIKSKEPTGQASIASFFQKKSPVLAALNSNKDSSVCGIATELNGKKKKKHKKTIETNVGYNHENQLASDLEMEEDRKVRFSEDIVEISPEPVKKRQSPEPNSVKINAFSFMMDNRHKSIGQNSSGIEVEHVEELPELKTDMKKKLLTRKVLFQEWSECKGSNKRKVEYVEQGLVIEEKLKKRAKRLKTMLNINKKRNNDNVLNSVKSKNAKKLSLNKHGETNGQCDTGSPHKWKMKLKVSLDKISTKKVDVKSTKEQRKQKGKEETDEIKVTKVRKRPAIIDSSSDSDSGEVLSFDKREKPTNTVVEKKVNADIKIAPLFIAAKGKSKVDKAIVEARKQFLHSSLPDSVKKVIEKQPKLEIPDYEVFPMVSHIKVKPDDSDVSTMISMSSVDLRLTASNSEIPKAAKLTRGCVTNLNETSSVGVDLMNGKKIKSFKSILQKLKCENPDYPIYRTFKSLYNKSNVNSDSLKKLKKGGRSKKKKNDRVKLKNPPQMWTEMYKPITSEEMLGNRLAVDKLKTWLQSWVEMNLTERISERRGSNSSSDFEDEEDEDSRNESSLLENTFILVGPHGSGKTAAVYAVCNEVGVNILEINASSKRTGKKLLLDLHEATQSYQVRKQAALSTYIKSNLIGDDLGKLGKMCLLLIEDVDLVFEQDDGFLTALSQLVVTSKRPIVLTTNDISCLQVKKFSTVSFPAMSPRFLTPWLQVLCLVEGTIVSRDSVVNLLENYRGDVRKTILQLQFWVESSGQCAIRDEMTPHLNNTEVILGEDDSSNLSWLNDDGEDLEPVPIQHVQFFEDQSLVDLGSIWWNTHNILQIPPPLRSIERKTFEEIVDNGKYDIADICNYFETLTLTDIVYKKFNLNDDFESVSKITYKIGGDSLELNESEEPYTSRDICCEWIKELCNAQSTNTKISCSPAEKLWRKKFSTCNENLLEVVPQVNHLQRNAISLDYLSTLRTMSRSEIVRAGNKKRRSRFYNYLRGLGLHCNEEHFKMISNAFYLEK